MTSGQQGGKPKLKRRFYNELHRRGIARVVNSQSSTYPDSPVKYLAEGRPWTPSWLMRPALNYHFRWMYQRRAADHRMTRLVKGRRTASGTVQWRAEFRHALAQPRTEWRVGAGL